MTDVVLQLRGLTISGSLEEARDFLAHLAGAPMAPPRRAAPAVRELAQRHAAAPARLALEPAPVPAAYLGPARVRKPAAVRVQPGQLSRPAHEVRGADVDEPSDEQRARDSIADRIVRAFEQDEPPPLPELAADIFGEQTGRALQKLKLALEQLVKQRRLARLGAWSFRAIIDDDEEADDDIDRDDEDTDSELG